MDKKSKIFFIIFGLLIAGSVAVTYWRIMIKKDYIIEAQTDCDPATETCFVWECDPESDEEGEACTGNVDEDIWYYKIVRRNASRIPLCDPADEDCQALICEENEPECEEILCTDENKEDQGVECNNPEEYVAENPEVEEDPSTGSEQESEEVCVEGEVCPLENMEEVVEGEVPEENVADESVSTSSEEEIIDENIATTTEEPVVQ